MKRKSFFALLVVSAAAILSLSSCGNKNKGGETPAVTTADSLARQMADSLLAGVSSDIKWSQDDVVAIADLGQYESIDDMKESPRYVKIKGAYPVVDKIQGLSADIPDGHILLLVPRDEASKVTVGEYTYEMFSGEQDITSARPLYRSDKGLPLLVRASIDSPGSVQISVEGKYGTLSHYVPCIGVKDGALQLSDGVKDITGMMNDEKHTVGYLIKRTEAIFADVYAAHVKALGKDGGARGFEEKYLTSEYNDIIKRTAGKRTTDNDRWVFGEDWDESLSMRVDQVYRLDDDDAEVGITITNFGNDSDYTIKMHFERGDWFVNDLDGEKDALISHL